MLWNCNCVYLLHNLILSRKSYMKFADIFLKTPIRDWYKWERKEHNYARRKLLYHAGRKDHDNEGAGCCFTGMSTVKTGPLMPTRRKAIKTSIISISLTMTDHRCLTWTHSAGGSASSRTIRITKSEAKLYWELMYSSLIPKEPKGPLTNRHGWKRTQNG